MQSQPGPGRIWALLLGSLFVPEHNLLGGLLNGPRPGLDGWKYVKSEWMVLWKTISMKHSTQGCCSLQKEILFSYLLDLRTRLSRGLQPGLMSGWFMASPWTYLLMHNAVPYKPELTGLFSKLKISQECRNKNDKIWNSPFLIYFGF